MAMTIGLLGSASAAVASDPQGELLPQRAETPFSFSELQSASSTYFAIDGVGQPEDNAVRQLAIHRMSDGSLVRSFPNPTTLDSAPRLDGDSVVALSESVNNGGIDTLTSTNVASGTESVIHFDPTRVLGYGAGWILTCSGAPGTCNVRLRTTAGVDVQVGLDVSYGGAVDPMDSTESKAVVATASGDRWAIDKVTGAKTKLAYASTVETPIRVVAGGRAFWLDSVYADGDFRSRLNWKAVDGSDQGSVMVDAPTYEYDIRPFGDRVALLRVPEDGDAAHLELRPINLTSGALEPRVAHSITALRSLEGGKSVLALGDTQTGRVATVDDDHQAPHTILTMPPTYKTVERLFLSGGRLAATYDVPNDDQDVYFTTVEPTAPWAKTGPGGITASLDREGDKSLLFSGDTVAQDIAPSSWTQPRPLRFSWPGGHRDVEAGAFGVTALGNGAGLLARGIEGGGTVERIQVEATKTGAVKMTIPGNPNFAIDRAWAWTISSDEKHLAGKNVETGATMQREFDEAPDDCSGRLAVKGRWATVQCDNVGTFVLDLSSASGSWKVPGGTANSEVALGGGFVAWNELADADPAHNSVVKVANLTDHEVRTYGPSSSASRVVPDDLGLRQVAYLDSKHQPRLLDVGWTDKIAPTLTRSGATPTVLPNPKAVSTFTFAGQDDAGAVRFDVGYRTYTPAAGYGEWTYPTAWNDISGPSVARTVPSGTTTCYRARAVDLGGNESAWGGESCTTSPLDDRSLFTKGSVTRGTNSLAMSGTESVIRTKGSALFRPGQRFREVTVTAYRGPNEGSVKVYAAGTYLGTMNLRSSVSGYTRMVFKSSTTKVGEIRLVSAGSKRVRVDAVALRP